MSNYTVEGTLKIKTPVQVKSDKFSMCEVIVEVAGQYPQLISVQFSNDKCKLLDPVQVGQQVAVHFNLQGRAWTNPQGETKYFNTLSGWKVEAMGLTGPHSTGSQAAPEQWQAPDNPASDPLPF